MESNFKLSSEYLSSSVLIVDDQPANVKLLQKFLSKSGFSHIQTETDSRNVEIILASKRVDIILLDIRMPHLDGFDIIKLIRRSPETNLLPIIVLTAQTDNETRYKALSDGANDFLLKPFDNFEVLLRIKNQLDTLFLNQKLAANNDLLGARVAIRTMELQETIVEIVTRLSKTAEFRDNDTGYHIIRMGKFTRIIAEKMNLDIDMETLEYAAAMHDIGKVAIPDGVLLKPAKLDQDEWEMMKQHTTLGGEILANSRHKLLQMAEIIALCHHEKFDGSGYPRQLAGEEIPIEARIVAVADVFDALTSERPYKTPWSIEDAVAEIQRSSGTHFDPLVVDAFMKALSIILEVKNEYPD